LSVLIGEYPHVLNKNLPQLTPTLLVGLGEPRAQTSGNRSNAGRNCADASGTHGRPVGLPRFLEFNIGAECHR
jgi:hypothetical protein